MRYVDEYRAPEQVMQLVAHLPAAVLALPHTAARPLASWRSAAATMPFLNSARPTVAGEHRIYSWSRLPGVRPADGAHRRLH